MNCLSDANFTPGNIKLEIQSKTLYHMLTNYKRSNKSEMRTEAGSFHTLQVLDPQRLGRDLVAW